MEGVAAVGDVAGAMKAIDVVVEQGEGSPADRAESLVAVQDKVVGGSTVIARWR